VKGGEVHKKKKGGDGGPLGGDDRARGGKVAGSLEDQGTGSFRQEGGYPVDHIGGDVGDEEPVSEGGGINVVKDGFNIEEEGGDLHSGSLEGFYFVGESKAGVGGAKSR